MKGNRCINQKPKQKSPKLVDKIMLKIILKHLLGKTFLKSLFCSHCYQVVTKPPIVSHVLSENIFENLMDLYEKSFFRKFCVIFVNREKNFLKVPEVRMKMVKVTWVIVIDLLSFFAMYVKKKFLKRKTDRLFLTIE